MRRLVRILCFALATSSLAIPLHIGDTWTWQIGNTWRTARVIDSSPADTGCAAVKWRKGRSGASLWRIEASDSVSKSLDTGTILAWPDGIQVWMHPTAMLPWEPTPLQVLRDSALLPKAGAGDKIYLRDAYDSLGSFSGGLYPWGGGPLLPNLTSGIMGTALHPSVDYSNSLLWVDRYEARFGYPFPWIRHGPTGMEMYQDWSERWELVSANGMAITVSEHRIILPQPGSSWLWREEVSNSNRNGPNSSWQTRTSVRVVHDSVKQSLDDSLGWKRIEIRETIDTSSIDYHCRILTGRSDSIKGCPESARYWKQDWRADTSGGMSSLSTRSESDGFYATHSRRSHWQVRSDGLLDSAQAYEDYRSGPVTYSEWTQTQILLAVNGQRVRAMPSSSISTPARPGDAGPNLQAKRFPDAPIRWRDLAGRSGTLRASDLLKPSASPRLLILDATFPDGTRWQGKFLTGSGR